MNKRDFYYPSSDGKTTIHGIEWIPTNVKHFKGVIQVAHGLTEQMTLYEPFAKYFTDRGFVVRGNDHLGHGESVFPGEPRLYFGYKGVWHFASDDIYTCRLLTENEYGKLPYIMFGFSMGSYLVRDYLIRYSETLDAAVLVGCLSFPSIATFWGNILVWLLEKLMGDKATPEIVNFFINESNNMKFKPRTGPIDWINEDSDERARLMRDPYCALKPTIGIFRDILYAIDFTKDKKNVSKMNKDIPIFFISGKSDPVARGGKTITDLVKNFEQVGIKDVHYKLFDGRHRIVFEKTGRLALDYIYDWACSKLKTEDINAMEATNPMLNIASVSLYTLARAGVSEAKILSGNIIGNLKTSDELQEYKSRYDRVTAELEKLMKSENVAAILDVGCGFAPRLLKFYKDGLLDRVKYFACDLPAVIQEAKEMHKHVNRDIDDDYFKSIDITNYDSLNEVVSGIDGKAILVAENLKEYLYDFEQKIAKENIIRFVNEHNGYFIKSEPNDFSVFDTSNIKIDFAVKERHRFRMRHETIDDTVKVRVEGIIDSITAPKLIDYISAMDVELNDKKLMIDLSNIDYILPAGINALEIIEDKYKECVIKFKNMKKQ